MPLHYIYVLRSLKNNKCYVGSTSILPKERPKQHNYGSNKWSKQNRPFKLVYYEEYRSKREAKKREKFLKSGVGRHLLNDLIKGS